MSRRSRKIFSPCRQVLEVLLADQCRPYIGLLDKYERLFGKDVKAKYRVMTLFDAKISAYRNLGMTDQAEQLTRQTIAPNSTATSISSLQALIDSGGALIKMTAT